MAKERRKKVMMLSEGVDKKGRPTKSVYYTTKNSSDQEKLKLKKFDPKAYNATNGRLGMPAIFNEKKLPK